MQGLALAEQFYLEHGASLIADRFGEYAGKIAVGLMGDGSECYGFDDKFSQDHDWGPGFCLWLTAEDFAAIGNALSRAYETLPQEYRGYRRMESEWGSGRVGVFEIGQFYCRYIGLPDAPDNLAQWMRIPENYLAAATAGRIFRDDLGQFSMIQAKLKAFYPEDVRRAKIGARCMHLGQSGQYNYARAIQRSEFYAARYAATKFCNDAMSLVFLLNKAYAPFYKWIHCAVKVLPLLGEATYEHVKGIIMSTDCDKIQSLMQQLCGILIDECRRQGLSSLDSKFMLDHGQEIHNSIVDEALRQVDVWHG